MKSYSVSSLKLTVKYSKLTFYLLLFLVLLNEQDEEFEAQKREMEKRYELSEQEKAKLERKLERLESEKTECRRQYLSDETKIEKLNRSLTQTVDKGLVNAKRVIDLEIENGQL